MQSLQPSPNHQFPWLSTLLNETQNIENSFNSKTIQSETPSSERSDDKIQNFQYARAVTTTKNSLYKRL